MVKYVKLFLASNYIPLLFYPLIFFLFHTKLNYYNLFPFCLLLNQIDEHSILSYPLYFSLNFHTKLLSKRNFHTKLNFVISFPFYLL